LHRLERRGVGRAAGAAEPLLRGIGAARALNRLDALRRPATLSAD
jgi:hypothetical protein